MTTSMYRPRPVSLFRRLGAGVFTALFTLVNGVFPHAAQANFWADRKKAAQRMHAAPAEDAGLLGGPSRLTPDQQRLFAQLPRTSQVAMFGAPVADAAGGLNVSAGVQPLDSSALIADSSWLSTLILPYGSLREIHLSSRADAPLIIHIQDAHGIEEAQRNIAGLIQALQESRGLNLVGVEGASGGFPLVEPLRAVARPEIVKDAAGAFLAEGTIGGPEYAALTSPRAPTLWGIEEAEVYEANVRAVKESARARKKADAALATLSAQASSLKEKIYSPALKDFDRRNADYQSQKESLGDHARYLMQSPVSRGGASWKNLSILVEAVDAEKTLDFHRVEQERLRLVERLAKALPRRALDDLVQKSLMHRLGQWSYGKYHAYLRDVCRSNGVSLQDLPQLKAYIDYVLLADEIDREGLLKELEARERAVEARLAASPEQARLAAAVRRLGLAVKLSAHQMSPFDWAAYEKERAEILALPGELRALAGEGAAGEKMSEALLAPFEDFCRLALQRNDHFVSGLLSQMKKERANAAVLVAGGFHSEDLVERFRRQGASIVLVTPKITEIPKDANYLDVFSRDPLPLEKMFRGEIISLKAEAAIQKSGPSTTRLAGAEGALEGAKALEEGRLDAEKLRAALQSLMPEGASAAVKTSGDAVWVEIDFPSGAEARLVAAAKDALADAAQAAGVKLAGSVQISAGESVVVCAQVVPLTARVRNLMPAVAALAMKARASAPVQAARPIAVAAVRSPLLQMEIPGRRLMESMVQQGLRTLEKVTGENLGYEALNNAFLMSQREVDSVAGGGATGMLWASNPIDALAQGAGEILRAAGPASEPGAAQDAGKGERKAPAGPETPMEEMDFYVHWREIINGRNAGTLPNLLALRDFLEERTESRAFLRLLEKIEKQMRYVNSDLSSPERAQARNFVEKLVDQLQMRSWSLQEYERIYSLQAVMRNLLAIAYTDDRFSPESRRVIRGSVYYVDILAFYLEAAILRDRLKKAPNRFIEIPPPFPAVGGKKSLEEALSTEGGNYLKLYQEISEKRLREQANKGQFRQVGVTGGTAAAYGIEGVPFIIALPRPGGKDIGGQKINFRERMLPGFQIARQRLGGLATNAVWISNLVTNIDGRTRTHGSAMLKRRVVPLGERLEKLQERAKQGGPMGEKALADGRDIITQWWTLQKKMWSRGVWDGDPKMFDNYGFDPVSRRVYILDWNFIYTDQSQFWHDTEEDTFKDKADSSLMWLKEKTPGMGWDVLFEQLYKQTLAETDYHLSKDRVHIALWPTAADQAGEELIVPLGDPHMVNSREFMLFSGALSRALMGAKTSQRMLSSPDIAGVMEQLAYETVGFFQRRTTSPAEEEVSPPSIADMVVQPAAPGLFEESKEEGSKASNLLHTLTGVGVSVALGLAGYGFGGDPVSWVGAVWGVATGVLFLYGLSSAWVLVPGLNPANDPVLERKAKSYFAGDDLSFAETGAGLKHWWVEGTAGQKVTLHRGWVAESDSWIFNKLRALMLPLVLAHAGGRRLQSRLPAFFRTNAVARFLFTSILISTKFLQFPLALAWSAWRVRTVNAGQRLEERLLSLAVRAYKPGGLADTNFELMLKPFMRAPKHVERLGVRLVLKDARPEASEKERVLTREDLTEEFLRGVAADDALSLDWAYPDTKELDRNMRAAGSHWGLVEVDATGDGSANSTVELLRYARQRLWMVSRDKRLGKHDVLAHMLPFSLFTRDMTDRLVAQVDVVLNIHDGVDRLIEAAVKAKDKTEEAKLRSVQATVDYFVLMLGRQLEEGSVRLSARLGEDEAAGIYRSLGADMHPAFSARWLRDGILKVLRGQASINDVYRSSFYSDTEKERVLDHGLTETDLLKLIAWAGDADARPVGPEDVAAWRDEIRQRYSQAQAPPPAIAPMAPLRAPPAVLGASAKERMPSAEELEQLRKIEEVARQAAQPLRVVEVPIQGFQAPVVVDDELMDMRLGGIYKALGSSGVLEMHRYLLEVSERYRELARQVKIDDLDGIKKLWKKEGLTSMKGILSKRPEDFGYEVVKELGRGGFAVVYQVRDPATGQEWAFKTFTPGFNDDPLFADTSLVAAINILTSFRLERRVQRDLEADGLDAVRAAPRDIPGVVMMEVVDGQSLDELPTNLSYLPASKAAKAAELIDRIHKAGYVIGDLNAGSIREQRAAPGRPARMVLMDVATVVRADRSEPSFGDGFGIPSLWHPVRFQTGMASVETDAYALGIILEKLMAPRNDPEDPLLPLFAKRKAVGNGSEAETPRVAQFAAVLSGLSDTVSGGIAESGSLRELAKLLLERGLRLSGGQVGDAAAVIENAGVGLTLEQASLALKSHKLNKRVTEQLVRKMYELNGREAPRADVSSDPDSATSPISPLAAIFYRHYVRGWPPVSPGAMGRFLHPLKVLRYWMGHPRWAAAWEWAYQAPAVLLQLSGAPWPLTALAGAALSFAFGFSHRVDGAGRRLTRKDRLKLSLVGAALTLGSLLPGAFLADRLWSALAGLAVNVAMHLGYQSWAMGRRKLWAAISPLELNREEQEMIWVLALARNAAQNVSDGREDLMEAVGQAVAHGTTFWREKAPRRVPISVQSQFHELMRTSPESMEELWKAVGTGLAENKLDPKRRRDLDQVAASVISKLLVYRRELAMDRYAQRGPAGRMIIGLLRENVSIQAVQELRDLTEALLHRVELGLVPSGAAAPVDVLQQELGELQAVLESKKRLGAMPLKWNIPSSGAGLAVLALAVESFFGMFQRGEAVSDRASVTLQEPVLPRPPALGRGSFFGGKLGRDVVLPLAAAVFRNQKTLSGLRGTLLKSVLGSLENLGVKNLEDLKGYLNERGAEGIGFGLLNDMMSLMNFTPQAPAGADQAAANQVSAAVSSAFPGVRVETVVVTRGATWDVPGLDLKHMMGFDTSTPGVLRVYVHRQVLNAVRDRGIDLSWFLGMSILHEKLESAGLTHEDVESHGFRLDPETGLPDPATAGMSLDQLIARAWGSMPVGLYHAAVNGMSDAEVLSLHAYLKGLGGAYAAAAENAPSDAAGLRAWLAQNAMLEMTLPSVEEDLEARGLELVKELGAGGTGVAYLVRDRSTKALSVVKTVRMRGEAVPLFRIVTIEGVYRSESEGYRFFGEGPDSLTPELIREWPLAIQMEFLDGEAVSTMTLEQMAEALRDVQEMNSRGVAHGDLKPDNFIRLRNPSGRRRLKLLDMGTHTHFDKIGPDMRVLVQTGHFQASRVNMAPEMGSFIDQFKGERPMTRKPVVGAKTDAYAAALMMFALPLDVRRNRRVWREVLEPGLRDDPATRLSAGQMADALEKILRETTEKQRAADLLPVQPEMVPLMPGRAPDQKALDEFLDHSAAMSKYRQHAKDLKDKLHAAKLKGAEETIASIARKYEGVIDQGILSDLYEYLEFHDRGPMVEEAASVLPPAAPATVKPAVPARTPLFSSEEAEEIVLDMRMDEAKGAKTPADREAARLKAYRDVSSEGGLARILRQRAEEMETVLNFISEEGAEEDEAALSMRRQVKGVRDAADMVERVAAGKLPARNAAENIQKVLGAKEGAAASAALLRIKGSSAPPVGAEGPLAPASYDAGQDYRTAGWREWQYALPALGLFLAGPALWLAALAVGVVSAAHFGFRHRENAATGARLSLSRRAGLAVVGAVFIAVSFLPAVIMQQWLGLPVFESAPLGLTAVVLGILTNVAAHNLFNRHLWHRINRLIAAALRRWGIDPVTLFSPASTRRRAPSLQDRERKIAFLVGFFLLSPDKREEVLGSARVLYNGSERNGPPFETEEARQLELRFLRNDPALVMAAWDAMKGSLAAELEGGAEFVATLEEDLNRAMTMDGKVRIIGSHLETARGELATFSALDNVYKTALRPFSAAGGWPDFRDVDQADKPALSRFRTALEQILAAKDKELLAQIETGKDLKLKAFKRTVIVRQLEEVAAALASLDQAPFDRPTPPSFRPLFSLKKAGEDDRGVGAHPVGEPDMSKRETLELVADAQDRVERVMGERVLESLRPWRLDLDHPQNVAARALAGRLGLTAAFRRAFELVTETKDGSTPQVQVDGVKYNLHLMRLKEETGVFTAKTSGRSVPGFGVVTPPAGGRGAGVISIYYRLGDTATFLEELLEHVVLAEDRPWKRPQPQRNALGFFMAGAVDRAKEMNVDGELAWVPRRMLEDIRVARRDGDRRRLTSLIDRYKNGVVEREIVERFPGPADEEGRIYARAVSKAIAGLAQRALSETPSAGQTRKALSEAQRALDAFQGEGLPALADSLSEALSKQRTPAVNTFGAFRDLAEAAGRLWLDDEAARFLRRAHGVALRMAQMGENPSGFLRTTAVGLLRLQLRGRPEEADVLFRLAEAMAERGKIPGDYIFGPLVNAAFDLPAGSPEFLAFAKTLLRKVVGRQDADLRAWVLQADRDGWEGLSKAQLLRLMSLDPSLKQFWARRQRGEPPADAYEKVLRPATPYLEGVAGALEGVDRETPADADAGMEGQLALLKEISKVTGAVLSLGTTALLARAALGWSEGGSSSSSEIGAYLILGGSAVLLIAAIVLGRRLAAGRRALLRASRGAAALAPLPGRQNRLALTEEEALARENTARLARKASAAAGVAAARAQLYADAENPDYVYTLLQSLRDLRDNTRELAELPALNAELKHLGDWLSRDLTAQEENEFDYYRDKGIIWGGRDGQDGWRKGDNFWVMESLQAAFQLEALIAARLWVQQATPAKDATPILLAVRMRQLGIESIHEGAWAETLRNYFKYSQKTVGEITPEDVAAVNALALGATEHRDSLTPGKASSLFGPGPFRSLALAVPAETLLLTWGLPRLSGMLQSTGWMPDFLSMPAAVLLASLVLALVHGVLYQFVYRDKEKPDSAVTLKDLASWSALFIGFGALTLIPGWEGWAGPGLSGLAHFAVNLAVLFGKGEGTWFRYPASLAGFGTLAPVDDGAGPPIVGGADAPAAPREAYLNRANFEAWDGAGRVREGMVFAGTGREGRDDWSMRENVVMDARLDPSLADFDARAMSLLDSRMTGVQMIGALFRFLQSEVASASQAQIEAMRRMPQFQRGSTLFIGQIIDQGWGVCRHKALLMQRLLQLAEARYPAAFAGMDFRMARGDVLEAPEDLKRWYKDRYGVVYDQLNDDDRVLVGRHVWVEATFEMNGKTYVLFVDPMWGRIEPVEISEGAPVGRTVLAGFKTMLGLHGNFEDLKDFLPQAGWSMMAGAKKEIGRRGRMREESLIVYVPKQAPAPKPFAALEPAAPATFQPGASGEPVVRLRFGAVEAEVVVEKGVAMLLVPEFKLIARLPAGGERLTVGRAPGVGAQLLHPGVSKAHAEIWLDQRGRVVVRDLGSANKTWVQGDRLRDFSGEFEELAAARREFIRQVGREVSEEELRQAYAEGANVAAAVRRLMDKVLASRATPIVPAPAPAQGATPALSSGPQEMRDLLEFFQRALKVSADRPALETLFAAWKAGAAALSVWPAGSTGRAFVERERAKLTAALRAYVLTDAEKAELSSLAGEGRITSDGRRRWDFPLMPWSAVGSAFESADNPAQALIIARWSQTAVPASTEADLQAALVSIGFFSAGAQLMAALRDFPPTTVVHLSALTRAHVLAAIRWMGRMGGLPQDQAERLRGYERLGLVHHASGLGVEGGWTGNKAWKPGWSIMEGMSLPVVIPGDAAEALAWADARAAASDTGLRGPLTFAGKLVSGLGMVLGILVLSETAKASVREAVRDPGFWSADVVLAVSVLLFALIPVGMAVTVRRAAWSRRPAPRPSALPAVDPLAAERERVMNSIPASARPLLGDALFGGKPVNFDSYVPGRVAAGAKQAEEKLAEALKNPAGTDAESLALFVTPAAAVAAAELQGGEILLVSADKFAGSAKGDKNWEALQNLAAGAVRAGHRIVVTGRDPGSVRDLLALPLFTGMPRGQVAAASARLTADGLINVRGTLNGLQKGLGDQPVQPVALEKDTFFADGDNVREPILLKDLVRRIGAELLRMAFAAIQA